MGAPAPTGVFDKIREKSLEQAQLAAERYGEASADRDEIRRRQERGEAFPDSPEALSARATRLIQRHGVPTEAVVEATRAEALDRPAMFERVLGVSKDLQAWSFLPRGARAARTVARISIRENGRELPLGTGFLVSPRLLLTNHHVLPDTESARDAFVEFDAQVTVDNVPDMAKRFDLDPGVFFATDEHLDFALVRVSDGADGRSPGEQFGWNKLSAQTGKLVVGEPVNIIGHPMGRLKEISIRENRLEVRLEEFLHYQTDTEPGNSGSPVYNDQWEVTALHHSGVPRTDAQGRTLRRDGQVWRPGDGDDAIDWLSNEGVRVSVILGHLAELSLNLGQRALLSEMGPESGFQEGVSAVSLSASPVAAPGESVQVGDHVDGVSERAPSTTRVSGLPARASAFGGTRHLVFLHGRAQEGRDPRRLRESWTVGLNDGLALAGQSMIEPADIWFPFYGDRLIEAISAREAMRRSVEEIAAAPEEAAAPERPSTRQVYEELLSEAAAMSHAVHGTPEETLDVVGTVHQGLSFLAATTGLDRLAIALIFRDVARYLDDSRVREAVLQSVFETMPTSGDMVLVSHSLGTVVAMDLLMQLDRHVNVGLLVTAGSPLGMDSVYRRLSTGGPKLPDRVPLWFNTWCAIDPVSVGCPLADTWQGGEFTEVRVENSPARVHDIEEYLAHVEVARAISDALTKRS
ncbi:serine protease [Sinosporangium siamense]|uniref:Serine protease n=1 Tax=Sinosporangium siamense TaxID=1367973 RepID=A0A919RMH6_9ACTN|nr:serine protease [Sinosporangium siamense]GII94886.1 hypothetical protein Ssi02_51170 [Sinosporangium siamense]